MKSSGAVSFKEYIKSKDILVLEVQKQEASHSFKIKQQEAREMIVIIADLQNHMKGYTGTIGSRLPNAIGQLIEGSKVQLRRLKRDMANLKEYGPITSFDKLLLKEGDRYLDRAERSIDSARKARYIENIYRSMRGNEICIGNVSPGNIGKQDKLYIKDISRCSYNLIECDAITFLSKAKRKGSKLEYIDLIKEYTKLQELDHSSFDFILAMVNYPYEFMKACGRYRSSKKNWTDEEYTESLRESMIKDGEEI